ncbi:MAG: hypothetical protein V9G24_04710 [Rhodoblastus sp.]
MAATGSDCAKRARAERRDQRREGGIGRRREQHAVQARIARQPASERDGRAGDDRLVDEKQADGAADRGLRRRGEREPERDGAADLRRQVGAEPDEHAEQEGNERERAIGRRLRPAARIGHDDEQRGDVETRRAAGADRREGEEIDPGAGRPPQEALRVAEQRVDADDQRVEPADARQRDEEASFGIDQRQPERGGRRRAQRRFPAAHAGKRDARAEQQKPRQQRHEGRAPFLCRGNGHRVFARPSVLGDDASPGASYAKRCMSIRALKGALIRLSPL